MYIIQKKYQWIENIQNQVSMAYNKALKSMSTSKVD